MSEWQPIMDAKAYRRVLFNARRISRREFQSKPNWVIAREVFGNGSNYSAAACHFAGIDPDGFEIDPFPTTA